MREERSDVGDRLADARQHRMAVARVMDGGREHILDLERAVVGKQRHVAGEDARHHGREEARARHEVEPELASVMRDGRALRRHALRAQHLRLAGARRIKDRRQIAARPAKLRLEDLQHQA